MSRSGIKWVWIIHIALVCSTIGYCKSQSIEADGSDPTTDKDFSYQIWMQSAPYLYVVGQPVNLVLRLTNHMNRNVDIRDCAQHYPFYSFEVIDPSGEKLELNKKLSKNMSEINPQWRTIKSGRIYEVRINLAEWFNLSKTGRYTIKSNWCVYAKRAPFKRESNAVATNIVEPDQANLSELIYRATQSTANGRSERAVQRKLVEIGDQTVPAIIKWLKAEKFNGGLHGGWNSYNALIRVLSQIASKEARDFIAQSQKISSESSRARLLRPIDIWQSKDRFGKLIEVLENGPAYNRKWAIFKLGVLGDKRAIVYLEKIAIEDEGLDIRETAKDALAHLKDPNVPMHYIDHLPSQKFELISSSDTYQLGEPITIKCKLVAGEYGSQTLVEFSRPAWHFLPWGYNRPFIITVDQKIGKRYDRLHPMNELRENESRLVNINKEPLDGYIDISKLGEKSSFELESNKSRLFVFYDISKAYKITLPGEYRILVSTSGSFKTSNTGVSNAISVNILPKE